jgi:uncharacterized membrane protein YidH (DUF202 family)
MSDSAQTSGIGKLGMSAVVVGVAMVTINGILMNSYVSETQNAAQVKYTITWVMITNAVMTLILGAIAYINMSSNPAFTQGYMMIMVHMAILLAIVALSVSVLTKS